MAAGRPRSRARSAAGIVFRACEQKELFAWYTHCGKKSTQKKYLIIFLQLIIFIQLIMLQNYTPPPSIAG